MAEYQNKGACDPGDSKVATVDFTAYIYVKEKQQSLWVFVLFVFVFFALNLILQPFHQTLILTN